MNGFSDTAAAIAGEQALVGRFTYDIAADAWTWSDEVFEIHALDPAVTVPTSKMMWSHKHPEDLAEFTEVLDRVEEDGQAFSHNYRIIDANGMVKHILIAGDGVADATGRVSRLRGYFIDFTQAQTHHAGKQANEAVRRSAEYRAEIEQAKGVLMFVYGFDSAAAMAMLRWWSQNHNVKIRELASLFISQVQVEGAQMAGTTQRKIDDVLEACVQDLQPAAQ